MVLYLIFSFDRLVAHFATVPVTSDSVTAQDGPSDEDMDKGDQPTKSVPQRLPAAIREDLPAVGEEIDAVDETIESISDEKGEMPPPAKRAPVVPPGKIPLGVRAAKGLRCIKCWDKKGVEHVGEKCDQPSVLAERFQERLYVIEKCRQQTVGAYAFGTLDLGVEVDFSTGSVSFWNGPDSELRGATQMLACIRPELAGLPLDGIKREFVRYQASLVVQFLKAQSVERVVTTRPNESLEDLVNDGRIVNVVRARVRVRKAPVDGEILGMLSAPSRVTLIEQDGDWCRVLTPRKNIGWMVCWGLGLDPGGPQPTEK
jgi:hypothetical protein